MQREHWGPGIVDIDRKLTRPSDNYSAPTTTNHCTPLTDQVDESEDHQDLILQYIEIHSKKDSAKQQTLSKVRTGWRRIMQARLAKRLENMDALRKLI